MQEDFARFDEAGITTIDVADHYGDAELLISKYVRKKGRKDLGLELMSKICYFGYDDMKSADFQDVRRRVKKRLANLALTKGLDMVQLYWGVSVT